MSFQNDNQILVVSGAQSTIRFGPFPVGPPVGCLGQQGVAVPPCCHLHKHVNREQVSACRRCTRRLEAARGSPTLMVHSALGQHTAAAHMLSPRAYAARPQRCLWLSSRAAPFSVASAGQRADVCSWARAHQAHCQYLRRYPAQTASCRQEMAGQVRSASPTLASAYVMWHVQDAKPLLRS